VTTESVVVGAPLRAPGRSLRRRQYRRWVTATTLGELAGFTIPAVVGYAFALRPWMLRWGTTREEAGRALPGDELVARPRYQQTHAVTIQAPPARVWPWLAQLGQGRGGLYSYDWLENRFGCDLRSADRIRPEWQRLEAGDTVRLVPEDFPAPLWLRVAS